jgi:hypothetical protein
MNIAKKYKDLTVSQFQEIEYLKEDKEISLIDRAINKISILTNKSIEEVENWTPKKIQNILIQTSFLNNQLEVFDCPSSFILGFKRFRFISEIHLYTAAQQKDFEQMVKNNNGNYIKCLPELMAICHQELTLTGWQYVQSNHFKNVELFKQSKLSETLGAVFFYSKCLKTYENSLADCIKDQTKIIQEIMKEIDSDLEFQTFLKNGAGNIQ